MGFFAEGKLKAIDLQGGTPFSVWFLFSHDLLLLRSSNRGRHCLQDCRCGARLQLPPGFHVGHSEGDAPAIDGDGQLAFNGPFGERLAIKRATDAKRAGAKRGKQPV
jgi:hypothetical protein